MPSTIEGSTVIPRGYDDCHFQIFWVTQFQIQIQIQILNDS